MSSYLHLNLHSIIDMYLFLTCFSQYLHCNRTNRDDALTTLGVGQVEDACADMMAKGLNPSVVKYSLASKCIDTANIVANRMMVSICQCCSKTVSIFYYLIITI